MFTANSILNLGKLVLCDDGIEDGTEDYLTEDDGVPAVGNFAEDGVDSTEDEDSHEVPKG